MISAENICVNYFLQNCPFTRTTASVTITVELENISDVVEGGNAHVSGGHILVGTADNKTILLETFRSSLLLFFVLRYLKFVLKIFIPA